MLFEREKERNKVHDDVAKQPRRSLNLHFSFTYIFLLALLLLNNQLDDRSFKNASHFLALIIF